MKKNDNKDDILRNLFDIYCDIYENKDKTITLSKLKYSPEEVRKAIELSINKSHDNEKVKKKIHKNKVVKLSDEVMSVTDENTLRVYYHNKLAKYFDPNTNLELKSNIIKNLSVNELKYLYSIISSVKLPVNKKKEDILQLIKMYFDGESRTKAMRI